MLLWLPAIAQMLFIFAASSVPGSQVPGRLWDKLAHSLVYAALGMFYLLPLARGRLSGVTWRAVAGAIALSCLYGISDEFHQRFVPDRTPDVMDVVADTIGAGAGVLFVVALRLVVERLRPGAR
jgi:VanZ family protein